MSKYRFTLSHKHTYIYTHTHIKNSQGKTLIIINAKKKMKEKKWKECIERQNDTKMNNITFQYIESDGNLIIEKRTEKKRKWQIERIKIFWG